MELGFVCNGPAHAFTRMHARTKIRGVVVAVPLICDTKLAFSWLVPWYLFKAMCSRLSIPWYDISFDVPHPLITSWGILSRLEYS